MLKLQMQASIIISVTIYTPANASLCITCIASCHRYCLCIDIHGVYTIPCLLWMCFFKRDLLNVVILPSSLPGIWEYVSVQCPVKCMCVCTRAHVCVHRCRIIQHQDYQMGLCRPSTRCMNVYRVFHNRN